MKIKIILLLILTIFTTAFYSEHYGFLTPSIKVNAQTDLDNHFVAFWVNANSTNQLEKLTITVYIKGNKTKETQYNLQNTKKVSLTYYYFLEKIKSKEITFVFTVKDNKGQRRFIREIYL